MVDISNLPMDSHNQYAYNQKELDRTQTKEDRPVAGLVQTGVTTPSYPELTALLEQEKCNTPWAIFPAPHDFYGTKSNCFSDGLIPRLGSQEHLLALREKIDSLPLSHQMQHSSMAWEAKKEEEEYNQQKGTIVGFFDTYIPLTEMQGKVNGMRNQFHRG